MPVIKIQVNKINRLASWPSIVSTAVIIAALLDFAKIILP